MITTIQWVETKDGEILAKKGEAYYRLSEISITDFLRENGIHPDQIKEKEKKPVEAKKVDKPDEPKKSDKPLNPRNITIVRKGKEQKFPLLEEMTEEEASFYKTTEQFAEDDLCALWCFSNGVFQNCHGFRVSVSRCLTHISEQYAYPIAIVRTNRGKNKVYAFHYNARLLFVRQLRTNFTPCLQKYWSPKYEGKERDLPLFNVMLKEQRQREELSSRALGVGSALREQT